MNSIQILLFALLIIYLAISLLRTNQKTEEGFDPSASPGIDIGTVRVQPTNLRGTNDIIFRFNKRFSRTPYVKLQALNDQQHMTTKNMYSLTIRNLTPTSCEVRINRTDGGNVNAPINTPFLIQYIAIEAPPNVPTP